MRLTSGNIELIVATVHHIEAELESPARLAGYMGLKVLPGWPPGEYDRGAQEFFCECLKNCDEADAGWYLWYAAQKEEAASERELVGAGGYFGPPDDDGIVEIGLSVMPAWRCRGYASEIAGMLISNAFDSGRVVKVIAHTSPSNIASRKMLEKNGMRSVCFEEDSGNELFEISCPR